MTKKKTAGPELIEDGQLDAANGGLIALLLPAVQASREAARASAIDPQFQGGVFVGTASATDGGVAKTSNGG